MPRFAINNVAKYADSMIHAVWSIMLVLLPVAVFAVGGNASIPDYQHARDLLRDVVYRDHRRTLYCDAEYGADRSVFLPDGFTTPSHQQRALRMEIEHTVPAENFGRFFTEWREGHPMCVDERGKPFKGRKCASLASEQFRLMEADMYNLFPAIGAVNALRSNYNYAVLSGIQPTFGSCAMKIADRKAEPPDRAKGQVARAALYFDAAYGGRYCRLSKQQKRLFEAWDRQFPVSNWECVRTRRIEALQGNEQPYVKKPCIGAGLW